MIKIGQYWYGVIERNKSKPEAFRQVGLGYLKLMEHSWWKNPYPNWFCHRLTEFPSRIAWVGDYSDDAGCPKELWDIAWNDDAPKMGIAYDELFTLDGKYLVNHTKQEYLDCDEYYKVANGNGRMGDGWVPHPLPLLTAIGNGRGGGDYRGVNQELIGYWAWDILQIISFPPADYTKLNLAFYESPSREKEIS